MKGDIGNTMFSVMIFLIVISMLVYATINFFPADLQIIGFSLCFIVGLGFFVLFFR